MTNRFTLLIIIFTLTSPLCASDISPQLGAQALINTAYGFAYNDLTIADAATIAREIRPFSAPRCLHTDTPRTFPLLSSILTALTREKFRTNVEAELAKEPSRAAREITKWITNKSIEYTFDTLEEALESVKAEYTIWQKLQGPAS